jgi:hypothetical protein
MLAGGKAVGWIPTHGIGIGIIQVTVAIVDRDSGRIAAFDRAQDDFPGQHQHPPSQLLSYLNMG